VVTAEIPLPAKSGPAVPAKRRKSQTWPPRSRGYKVFKIVNAIILIGVVLAVLLPFVNLLAQSFSGETYITQGSVSLWPKGFNVTTYQHVMSDPQFWENYRNTVLYTVASTAVAMVLTVCYAYVLSRRNLRGRKALTWIAIVTMFFNGGIIPNYILVSSLHLRDTVWAYALPNAIIVFNLLIMKTFFESLPAELEEAAAIDGLNTYRTLWRIVLPLSKAVLATIALFYAVQFWNDWFSALLYMDNQGLYPVSLYLENIVASLSSVSNIGQSSDVQLQIAANIQAVTVVLVAVPILCVYPFIQRYFVSGVVLGAVKG
jgi:putative aldouronate transport system permease protein